MQSYDPSPAVTFRPTATWPTLRLRAELLRRLRAFFDGRGFLEVETPVLSREVVVERQLDPLRTTLFSDPREPEVGPRYWLKTSPEAHMKRLMAAGGEAIYQVTRAFRGGERGDRHNPEFTIVEWYRRDDTLADGMRLLSELCEALLSRGPARRVSYAHAFREHVGLDAHGATVDELAAAAVARGSTAPPMLPLSDRDAWLNFLLAELVEPHLGRGAPTILYDYPASQAALAEVGRPEPSSDAGVAGVESAKPQNHWGFADSTPATPPFMADVEVAKRFELYVDGMELANGYLELLDADVLVQRMDRANDQRVADAKRPLPPATHLVAAMRAGLPPCVGVALGFDRVAMLAAGATRINDVLAFPVEHA